MKIMKWSSTKYFVVFLLGIVIFLFVCKRKNQGIDSNDAKDISLSKQKRFVDVVDILNIMIDVVATTPEVHVNDSCTAPNLPELVLKAFVLTHLCIKVSRLQKSDWFHWFPSLFTKTSRSDDSLWL